MNLKRRIKKMESVVSIKKAVDLQKIMDDFLFKISDTALKSLLEHVKARQASLPQAELKEIQDRILAALSPDELQYYKIWRTLKVNDFIVLQKMHPGYSEYIATHGEDYEYSEKQA